MTVIFFMKNSNVSENSDLYAKYKMHQEDKKMLLGSVTAVSSAVLA